MDVVDSVELRPGYLTGFISFAASETEEECDGCHAQEEAPTAAAMCTGISSDSVGMLVSHIEPTGYLAEREVSRKVVRTP
jgi:hypothetical protein